MLLVRRKPLWAILGFILWCVLIAVQSVDSARDDRGIEFSHTLHVETHELRCDDCHGFEANERILPNHNLCGVCHEIDEQAEDSRSCRLCHTRDDYSVDPLPRSFTSEVKFEHSPHLADEIDCSICHPNPQKRRLAQTPAMPLCMDCHEEHGDSLTACAVCHREITDTTLPTHRGSLRIAHDSPQVWERTHGREYAVDPEYCARCHVNEVESCETCHRQEAPTSHTASWRRRTHGLHASWNRNECAVCHEEDSCLKCHSNTRPASHRRAGWDSPRDRHCVSCHFPAERNNCTVCHETVEHSGTPSSPHNRGVFPSNCTQCHPGGNPFRAPHPVNNTVRCGVCHQR